MIGGTKFTDAHVPESRSRWSRNSSSATRRAAPGKATSFIGHQILARHRPECYVRRAPAVLTVTGQSYRAYFPMAALSFYSLLSFQCNSIPLCPESAIARNYEAFNISANAFVCCGACACCSLISCGRPAKAFACHRAPTVARRQVGGIYGGASRCYKESIGEKYLAGLGEWWGAAATDVRRTRLQRQRSL